MHRATGMPPGSQVRGRKLSTALAAARHFRLGARPTGLYTCSVTRLAELEVLVVDCQATRAGERGHLLELGWAAVREGEVTPTARLPG